MKDYKSLLLKLFLFIVIIKIIYVISEYFYNINILNVSSSLDFFNEEKMNQINDNGHLISSFGITLLLTPLIYFIISKIFKINIGDVFNSMQKKLFYIFIPIFIFTTSYISLNKLVDYIVEKNLDKSYQAYYLNIFKIGLMNNYYKYDSFLNSDNIKNNNLNTNDKIMFVNTFLLLNADKELLEKLKAIGKTEFLKIYIDQNKEDFDKKFSDYLIFDKEITNSFEEFQNEKIKINSKLNSLNNKTDEKNATEEFKKLNNTLESEYKKYKSNININLNLINDQKKLSDIIDELNTYVENRTKYESFYKKRVSSLFGRYIPVERFTDNNGKPNIMKLKNALNEELITDVLSFEDFKRTSDVINTIYNNLKSKNLNPTKNVDYTIEKNFLTLFSNNKNKIINDLEKNIKNDLNKKLGKNDLTFDMDYGKYIKSNFIKNKIVDNLNKSNLKGSNVENIISVLNSKDKENAFKEEIYLNIIKQNKIIEKYLFEEEDFKNKEEAKELGVKAIKLLYIPIFALSLSIISLLLNSGTILTLIVGKTFNLNKIYTTIINLILIGILVCLPFINNEKVVNNKIVEMLSNNENINTNYHLYFKFLDFLSYYENLLN